MVIRRTRQSSAAAAALARARCGAPALAALAVLVARLPLGEPAAGLPDVANGCGSAASSATGCRWRRCRRTAAVGGGGGGRELLPTLGVRPRRHPRGAGRQRPAARRLHHQPAGGEERLPLAGADLVRKGLEAGFTVLIEVVWPKRRIMEVYLNVAEMGEGVFGAEAAARHYWKAGAADLGPQRSARLMACSRPARPLAGLRVGLHRPARRGDPEGRGDDPRRRQGGVLPLRACPKSASVAIRSHPLPRPWPDPSARSEGPHGGGLRRNDRLSGRCSHAYSPGHGHRCHRPVVRPHRSGGAALGPRVPRRPDHHVLPR